MTTGNHEGEVGMSSQRVSGTAVQRTIAVLGSAVFFVVAPFTLAGLVPWWITGWQLRPPFLGLELTRGIGAIMILAGVPGIIIIAPMPRVSSRPRNGGRSCQPVIDHGTSPANVNGATTKKTAEPRTAMVRCTAVPDTRCELNSNLPFMVSRRHPGADTLTM